MTQAILKPFNVASDHLLIDSEFYQEQMKCVFSKPIIEKRILLNKNAFISNILKKYSLDISHLTNECREHEKKVKKSEITEYDERRVRQLIEKITVYEDRFEVMFKSQTTEEIKRIF